MGADSLSTLALKSVLLACVGALPMMATGQRMSPDDFIEYFATPIATDEVFYRWQSTAAGENLVSAGTMTPRLDRYFMDHKAVAGPGVYMAGNELSSSSFMPPEGGNVIEVHVRRGTRILDITEPRVAAAFARHRLDTAKFWDRHVPSEGLLIRYTGDWVVAKTMANQIEFHRYPHAAQPDSRVIAALKLAEPRVRDQLLRQVHRERPQLFPTIADHVRPQAELLRLTSDADLAPMVDRLLRKSDPGHRPGTLLEAFAGDPRVGALLGRDETLRARAMTALAGQFVAGQPRDHLNFLTNLARADRDRGKANILSLVTAEMEAAAVRGADHGQLSSRVVPILKDLSLNDVERGQIAAHAFMLAMNNTRPGPEAAGVRAILAAARVSDGNIEMILKTVDSRYVERPKPKPSFDCMGTIRRFFTR